MKLRQIMALLAILGIGMPPAKSPSPVLGRSGFAEGLMYLFPVPAAESSRTSRNPVQVGGPRSWFEEAGILICRPVKDSPCRLATAIIGNHNGVGHNHNDVGSYLVVLDDRVLIVDPGAEEYTSRTFSSRRYESNVLNSFGHCVPRVAGRMQEEGPQARAVTLKTEFTDIQDTLVFDICSAYSSPQLQKLTRTYVFSRRGAGSLTVTDEVAFSEPASFETALITLGQWKQTGPGTLRIEESRAAIRVEIDAGGLDLKIVPTKIDEHVHTPRQPVRIGVQIEPLVRQAAVTVRITPDQ